MQALPFLSHIPASTRDLPVCNILAPLLEQLTVGRNAVVIAPPGAGKTSLVPLALLQQPWATKGKIIMLEPRRLAVRAAARRMATLLDEEPGERIGYRTRLERKTGALTRIEVVTEGLMLQRMLDDPTLDNVAAVIFDEIHERSLEADCALAFCLDLQKTLRPDLRLIAMSATVDGARLSSYLDAPVLESPGRNFEVDIHHAAQDIAHLKDLPKKIADTIMTALHKHEGNILAFLPGAADITRAHGLLQTYRPDADIFILHGDMSSRDQDGALSPALRRRRIILATSIAETSLTVPGVRIVVDGGFRRAPAFNPGSGLTRLQTVRISRATAAQRSGRAGREAPGVAFRLWTKAQERGLQPFDQPEILQAELTNLRLHLAAWQNIMGTAPDTLGLPDAPPKGALAAAELTLSSVGALDHQNHITPVGFKMARLGAHPRLAAMMLAARNPQEQALAALIAALLEERDPLRPRFSTGPTGRKSSPADIRLRLDLLQGARHPDMDRTALAHIRQTAAQYRQRLGTKAPAGGDCAMLLAAAFPDRIAQARGDIGSFRLSGGGSAKLNRDDALAKESLLVVAELHTGKSTEIRLAAPIALDSFPPALRATITEQTETSLDPTNGTILSRCRRRLGTLILEDRTCPAAAQESASLLVCYAVEQPLNRLHWSDSALQLRARVMLARELFNADDYPDLADEPLKQHLKEWLFSYMDGINNANDLKKINLFAVLRDQISYTALAQLEHELPTHIITTGGRVAIDYTQPVPLASARAQMFFGMTQTPLLARGKLTLRLALLSPANRVQAITTNLAEFWDGGWKDMRRDMRGRYPRHDWPENPALYSSTPRKR